MNIKQKENLKEYLVYEIRKTRQGKKIYKLETFPLATIAEIYQARKNCSLLSPEDFNIWLRTQSFYANGANLNIVAYVLNLTTERVRQIEKASFKKLIHPRLGLRLKNYMEMSVNPEI